LKIETDYLVVGCGASAMAFVDAMLDNSDATITIVDRRHAPGGHWNDAYPFVRLHQPSSYYGVSSRPLGRGQKDERGYNKGFYELASGTEVANYFHELMRDSFLTSGRVTYHPMSDYRGNGEFVSLLSQKRHKVDIRKKLVDATVLNTNIPLTHERKFEVAEGLVCIPPNHLPRMAPDHQRFAIIGAGKTAIDSITWLLENGAAPEALSWILPRDPWFINRAYVQPGMEFFEQTFGGLATQYEIWASAASEQELCERMEAAGIWLRIDKGIWPSMFHAATLSEAELEQLRRVPNMIRKGYVQRIEADRIILDGGDVASAADTLFVDCTARALAHNVNSKTPVFTPDKISLQMVRGYQPTFSAALIGRIEATISDEEEKTRITRPTPMTDTVEDWISMQAASLSNQIQWVQNGELIAWMNNCRLDGFGSTLAQIEQPTPEISAILGRVMANSLPAKQNLQQLAKTRSSE